jgi:hypothetical protein
MTREHRSWKITCSHYGGDRIKQELSLDAESERKAWKRIFEKP